VGNEIVQARLALQTWRPQFVACIGGANASVLAVMELLDILIRVQPGGADSGDISRRLEGRCTDPAVSDAPTPQLVYCVLFAYQ
jgi:hypothetical protein